MKAKHVFRLILMAGMMLFFLSSVQSSSFAQMENYGLQIESQPVQAGRTYTQNIFLNTPIDAPVIGLQFDLAFDPALIQLVSIREGSYFKECVSAKGSFFIPGQIDNARGKLVGTGVLGLHFPADGGCAGSGVVAILEYQASAAGQVVFALSNAMTVYPHMLVSEDPSPQQNETWQDLNSYAASMNVSPAEAERRNTIREQAGPLEAQLTQNESDSFAGLWWEHTPEFKLVIRFTRDGIRTASPYLQNLDLANEDFIEIRSAEYTLVELQEAAELAANQAAQAGIQFDGMLDIRANTVKLFVAPGDHPRLGQILSEEHLLSAVTIVETQELSQQSDVYGGLELSQCISGFSVIKFSTNQRGITTAGHCNNQLNYQTD